MAPITPHPDNDAHREARQLALSVGLGMWGLGAAITTWVAARSPLVDGFDAALWIVLPGVMLAALVADVGWRWDWKAGRRARTVDPAADAWWLLTWYPIFPAAALYPLRDAGFLTGDQQFAVFLAVLAGVLFVRGLALLSPAGGRLLNAEARRPIAAGLARRLAMPGGAGYAVAGAAMFAASAAGRPGLAAGLFLLGLVAVRLTVLTLTRRASHSAVSPLDRPAVRGAARRARR